jgi:hypothetical protein
MNPKNIPLMVAFVVFGLVFLISSFSNSVPGNRPSPKNAAGSGEGHATAGSNASGDLSGQDSQDANQNGSSELLSSILPSALIKRHAEKPQIFGADGPVTIDQVPRGRFRRELIALKEPARQAALRKLGELKVPIVDVNSIHAVQDGSLFYACPANLDTVPLPPEATAPSQSKVPLASPPACSSRPSAPNTLFLNFSGYIVSDKAWNADEGVPVFEALPYDLDGDSTTFNQYEQAQIVEAWKRVSEDFKPFNINVTTVKPQDLETNNNVLHALITKNSDAKGRPMPSASAGGVAWLSVFGSSNAARRSPAFSYYNNGGSVASNVAEVVSHEAGHNFGLSHDGLKATPEDVEYYGGHGKDQQSWAPIMGAGYGKNFTQWTTGNLSYNKANNPEDDIDIIGGQTEAITDDVPNTIADAPEIKTSAGKFSTKEFMIGVDNDEDVHKIVTDASTLDVVVSSFKVPSSASAGSNLGLKAEILDPDGNPIQANASGQNLVRVVGKDLTPGTYYIRVSGSGCGNSTSSKPTGFPADGSMGTYSISGSISGGALDGNATTSTALTSLSVSSGVLAPSPTYRYKVTSNGSVAAGQSVSLPFEASPANPAATLTSLAVQPPPAVTPTPTPGVFPTPTPQPQPLSVSHSVTRTWGSGMQGQLLLRNITKAAIPDWSLAFEYPSVIASSSFPELTWTRELISREYIASVPNETASISVNLKTVDETATTQVRLNSGNFSTFNGTGNFSLSEGENTITFEVTAPDNVTKGYHRLSITRQPTLVGADSGTKLSAVSFSAGTWLSSFSANASNYSVNIPNASGTISINAIKSIAGGKIEAKINNGAFFSLISARESARITLPIGSSVVELKVTSANGTASSYFFNLNRAGSSPSLSNLLVRWNSSNITTAPAFSSNTTTYNATVANSVSLITVTPTLAETNSSVAVRVGSGNFTTIASGNTSLPLFLTANATSTLEVKVLSDNNTTNRTYSLNMARLAAPVTSPVGSILLNGTTLNGTIDARSTSASFQFGSSATFGTTLLASSVTGNGTAPVSTSTSSLQPSATYYYRLTSQYGGITDFGNTETFITPPSSDSSALSQLFLTGANATTLSGATFTDFGFPAINKNADTAFQGYVSYGVSGSKILGGTWTTINGTTSLAAGIGLSAPDGAVFSGIGEPILDDARRMTFAGYLKIGFGAVAASNSAGIWQVASNGTISKIARAGENATGATGTVFSTFNKLVAGNGGIAFTATLASGSSTVNSTNNTGLWAQNSAGSLVLVARTGASPTPTLRNFTIFNAETAQNSQSRHFNESGDLVLAATFGNGSTGIYRATKSGNFTLNATSPLVAIGSAVPGVTGGNFTTLGNPIINSAGDIAFRATFSGNGVSSGNNMGIFRYSANGTGTLVVRTGVASGNQTFLSLSSPLINNAKDIVFTGALATGGNVTSSNANGIWMISSNGTLTKIFRSGDSAPGVVGATLASFSQLAFPANGGTIFAATLATGSGGFSNTNNQGVWVASASGANPKLVVRTGNSLSVGGAGKTISSFDFFSASSVTDGVGRTMNSDGDMILKLNFTDKSSGLFRYDAP